MEQQETKTKNWYDRWYKALLIPPVLIVLISLFYIYSIYSETGDFLQKDASLAGGTTITIQGDTNIDELENALKVEFPDVYVRRIGDISTGRNIAFIVGSSAGPEQLQSAVEKFLGYGLNAQNSNIEFSGSALGSDFYKQLIIAIIISFILMSIVIFFMFRSFIPSIAVIFAAFSDIVTAIAIVNFLGIKLSAAGIAAFLMLIGYSVDTDILLTTRVLKKKEGSVNQRIYSAFRTGIFMTLAGLAAVLPAFFIVTGLPDSFRQIFLIVAFGLTADIIMTWLGNASIIKWYADYKKLE